MSAGGLSYSGLVNHGRVTLPSVDSWGTNMNILRDPPKSYYTRRSDKVGETSSITQMIDDSGDRGCEAIQVYARGINPFVSVSYSNNSNNGGQHSGGLTTGGQQQTKLPYTVMRDGAFRPPVLLQEDLLPLSRMPRAWTSAFSQPGFTDFSRKLRSCGTSDDTREVKSQTLKSCVRPTAVYKIETPISEPFEVKYVIQPSIKNSATSGIRTMDITQQYVGNPTKEIDTKPLHAHAQANFTKVRHVDNNEFNPDRYIQDANTHTVVSNISSNKHYTDIETILDLTNIPVQDIRTTSTVAPVNGVEQTKYFHDDINLSRRLPEYHARTNFGDHTTHKRVEHENQIELERNIPNNSFVTNPATNGFSDHSSRDARLASKIQLGGYSIPGQIPMQGRMRDVNIPQQSEKSRMNRAIMKNMHGRFVNPHKFGAPSALVK